MQINMPDIPIREVLHFLGWHGTPVEDRIINQIHSSIRQARSELQPHVVTRYFSFDEERRLTGTVFTPKGNDIHRMLSGCDGAVLMAATLGAKSERMLLRCQARSGAEALILDAVLSAAIEAVCDEQERMLRKEYHELYLTDRFSPGYGDMPIEQTKEICAVLQAEKAMGLTVSASGIMIPRKSVTAILGVSSQPQPRRAYPCLNCTMRNTCALRE